MEPNNETQLAHAKPKLLTRIKAHWHPRPLKVPHVDPDLPHLNALQRAVEALRYGFLSLEHWMSPSGRMREYLRLLSILAFLLLIPALLIIPIFGIVVWQVAGLVTVLLDITIKLVVIPVLVLLGILITRLLIKLLRRG